MIPPASPQQQVTQLLCDWRNGDEKALEKLIPLIQPELHRLAHAYMSRERAGHTLQTTALLDDAYMQLAGGTGLPWQNRAHFFAIAAQLMRRIMVHHARKRRAQKRGGDAVMVKLDEAAVPAESRSAELVALDEALEELAAFDQRRAQVVEMRYFGGLTMQEIAEVLNCTRQHSIARLDGSAGMAFWQAHWTNACDLRNGNAALRFSAPHCADNRSNVRHLSIMLARATNPCDAR